MKAEDMTGRVCVVTVATRGIGRATVEGLAVRGASVVLIARRSEDGMKVSRVIARAGGATHDIVSAELSSQASIQHAAAELKQRHPRLHVLINNAGIITRDRELTVDGIEKQFAVNHLAYFLLSNLLLDQLLAGAPSRIINVSSGARRSHTGLRRSARRTGIQRQQGIWSVQAGEHSVHL